MSLLEAGSKSAYVPASASAKRVVLEVKEISKIFSYDDKSLGQNRVLDRINLDIHDGELVTIVGPSGCGKSTLLNIIAGLETQDSGKILMNGEEKHSTDPNRVVIFQEGALFPWMSVLDNVEFGLRMNNTPRDLLRKIANDFIRLVQLTQFANSYVHQLSGGMKQRVAIARALALNPTILLMDEPFAALDVHTRDLLHDELLRIHAATKKTMLFVTHDINEAILLGDRVIVLSPRIGNIKNEFRISATRPRDIDNPEIAAVKRQLLHELEEEFRYAKRT